MQQHEWAERAGTPPPSWACLPPYPVHPSRPSQSSLCYTARSHWLCVLHLLVYMSGKAMAPHSSTLAWSIPWTEEPGGLRSMGSLGVRHDWATSLFTFMHWRRKWQPTPVFLPENPRDGGVWWASVYRVAQSRTRLKRLSSSSHPSLRFTFFQTFLQPHHPLSCHW